MKPLRHTCVWHVVGIFSIFAAVWGILSSCGVQAPRCSGLLSCGAQSPGTWVQQVWLKGPRGQALWLWHTGTAAPQHVGPSWTGDRASVPCSARRPGSTKVELVRAQLGTASLSGVGGSPVKVGLRLSMGFPRQGYWSGLPLPSPGYLPDPGIKPMSPALTGGFLHY